MKQNISRLINWFVDFASLDLDKCDLGQLSKLRTELAQIYIVGYLGRPPSPLDEFPYYFRIFEIERMHFQDPDKIKPLQKKILSIRDQILEGIEGIADKAEFEWVPYDKAKSIKGVELISDLIHLDFEINVSVITQMEYDREGGDLKVRWPKNWRDKGCFRVLKFPKGDPEDVLLLRFAELLEIIPITAFRRCRLCQKLFFHVSKRERFYCSNLCAAKAGNKAKRDAIKKGEPDRYNEELRKGRRRAEESYDKKVKMKHPKAKIRKRNRSSRNN